MLCIRMDSFGFMKWYMIWRKYLLSCSQRMVDQKNPNGFPKWIWNIFKGKAASFGDERARKMKVCIYLCHNDMRAFQHTELPNTERVTDSKRKADIQVHLASYEFNRCLYWSKWRQLVFVVFVLISVMNIVFHIHILVPLVFFRRGSFHTCCKRKWKGNYWRGKQITLWIPIEIVGAAQWKVRMLLFLCFLHQMNPGIRDKYCTQLSKHIHPSLILAVAFTLLSFPHCLSGSTCSQFQHPSQCLSCSWDCNFQI